MHYLIDSERISIRYQRHHAAREAVPAQRMRACHEPWPSRPFRNCDSANSRQDCWEGCWVGYDGVGWSDEVQWPLVLDRAADARIDSHGANLEVSFGWFSRGPIFAYVLYIILDAIFDST